LKSINLYPLSKCDDIQIISAGNNAAQTIDITPFVWHPNLGLEPERALELDFEPDKTVSWLNIQGGYYRNMALVLLHHRPKYQRPQTISTWSFLHKIVRTFENDWRVKQDVLCAMGLSNLGYIDFDMIDLFLSIPASTPIEQAREHVLHLLIDRIVKEIHNDLVTTGLKLEEMATQHRDIAKMFQQIVEIRKREMELVRVGLQSDLVDLRELYLTAYGYEVLTALGMRLTTSLEGLEQVRKNLADLGYELKTSEFSVSGVQMSDELRGTIWWIVENRGRLWKEIIKLEKEE
jgi:hypothetical protein